MATKDQKPSNAPHEEVETTGHEWDGIKEYNNPLPRWWLWTFIASIIFAIGYCIYYPAWPTLSGWTKGTAEWTSLQELDARLAYVQKRRDVHEEKMVGMSVSDVLKAPEVAPFAIAGGKAAFALHCSQCHGAGGQGAKGYPSLLDDEWLWGGSIDDILTTITHGIRDETDDETRLNMMTSFGKDELLSASEIKDVTRFVQYLSGSMKQSPLTEKGRAIFAENCTACHGEAGEGVHEMGAPALNNAIWLYGGDAQTLYESVYNGRGGVMPAFGKRLDEATLKKLAVYVYSLSGGEAQQ